MGSGLRKGTRAASCYPILLGCPHTHQSWSRVREGMLGAYCWLLLLVPVGGGPHPLGSPQTGLKLWLGWDIPKPNGPALAPKALERVGVSPVGLMPSVSPLVVLSLNSTHCSPCIVACRCAAVQGSLSKTGPAIMGTVAARITPICLSPPMTSFSGAIWGTGWATALPCPGQGGHQFGNLLPQFCGALPRVSAHSSPNPYRFLDLHILTFNLVGGNH